ncbi:MAG: ComF family protein [Chitinispirillales bacterium]|jgi:ComF family protein|nr:ComF family protein [Chitinispirillales bacterium]
MGKQKTPLPFLRRLEDFFIPSMCIICDGARDRDDNWFCQICVDALAVNYSRRDACPRCSQNRRKRECACELAWDYPFEKVLSAYDYDDTVSAIVHHIKYKGKSQLAYHIGFITAPLLPREFFSEINFYIPVPLHKARAQRRGYNQAEYFARGLLRGLGHDLKMLRTDLLARVKNTGTQTKLDKDERLKNLDGAFTVSPGNIIEMTGKRVALVDDVMTTGATAEACTEELLRAGCASVRVVSLGKR